MKIRYIISIITFVVAVSAQEANTLADTIAATATASETNTSITVPTDSSTVPPPLAQPNIVISAPAKDSISKPKGKPNIAVLDFTGSYAVFSREEIQSIANRFETEMMKTDTFRVLERRNMDAILQEQDFIQSDRCNTSECRTKVGQLLGVDLIITGEVSKVGHMISLNVKMINVESGSNIKSHVLDINGELQDVIRGGCFEMAQIFSGRKEPEKDHSVLSIEKPSVLPWIIGGLGTLALGFGTYLLLNQNENTVEDYTVNTGF